MLEKEKLTFHSISLEDKEWMTQKLREDNYSSCEYAFANNFMWSEVFEVEVGQAYDCGIIRYRKGGEFSYSFPFGNGDKKRAVELLRGILRPTLKSSGMLTRDARVKERKKPGQPGARRRFQFSKR